MVLICLLTDIDALWYLNAIRRSVAMTLDADCRHGAAADWGGSGKDVEHRGAADHCY